MKYKISYQKHFDKDGYVYKQMVTLFVSEREMLRANLLLSRIFENNFDEDLQLYFFSLSANRRTAEYFGYDTDKRFKTDRNTCIRIIS
jgi:hypothetical protein